MLGRWLAVTVASVVGTAVACGGQSQYRSGDDGGSGGSVGNTGGTGVGGTTGGTGTGGTTGGTGTGGTTGGTGTGGTGAVGGTGVGGSSAGRGGSGFAGRQNMAGTGGRSVGGASGAGNASGMGNMAGAGGLFDRCATPTLVPCDGGVVFYHDAETGECVPAGPGACATPGAFLSLAECLMACPGSEPAADACDEHSQCVVVDPGCCGHCDPVTVLDLTAANVQRVEDVRACPGGVACGACPDVPELERTRQYFYSQCLIGRCQLVDVRTTTSVACSSDDDCYLRAGAGCCQSCQGSGFVALSSSQYLQQICANVACDDCAPAVPTEVRAACDGQRCRVVEASAGAANGGAAN